MKPDRSFAILAIGWTFFLGMIIVSVALVRCAQSQPLPPDRWLPHRYIGKVTASDIHDGDTFTAEIANDFGVTIYGRIRLAGVDAPELVGPEKEAGRAAKAALEGLIAGQVVYLEVLVTRSGRPVRSYERTVARAWIERDGQLQDVAGLLIGSGHGRPIPTREIVR